MTEPPLGVNAPVDSEPANAENGVGVAEGVPVVPGDGEAEGPGVGDAEGPGDALGAADAIGVTTDCPDEHPAATAASAVTKV